MLRPVREECGLGCPPDIFTTNASESVNAMLKHKVDYKRNELPMFINKVMELVQEQQREVERAVVCRSKYQFREQYQHLVVAEDKWFAMNPEQRQRHLSRVQSAEVCSQSDATLSTRAEPRAESFCHGKANSCTLSVDFDSAAMQVNVPVGCLEGIWTKASALLCDGNAISPAPGQDKAARMVLSYSGKVPYLVTPKKGGGFNCDSSCPNWKALSLSAHIPLQWLKSMVSCSNFCSQ